MSCLAAACSMGIAAGLPAVCLLVLAIVSGSGLCLLGCREQRRSERSCQVDLPEQTSYTEHGECSRNHGGGRDAQPVEKQAAAKYKVIWKCSKEAGKKKMINNNKKKKLV